MGRTLTKNLIITLLAAAVLLLVAYVSYSWLTEPSRMQEVFRRVQVGMPLEEAKQALSDAQYYIVCLREAPGLQPVSEHYFLYGSRKPQDARVIFLQSEKQEGQDIVTHVAMPESDRVLISYAGCRGTEIVPTKPGR